MMIEDEELRSLYKAASAERIQKIEAGLLHLEKNPQDKAKLEGLLRETHSLKGDSRMLGVKDVETLTHQIEEILGSVKQGERVFTSQLYECLSQGLDAIRKIAHEAVTGQPAGVSVFHVLAQLMRGESSDAWSEIPETVPENIAESEEDSSTFPFAQSLVFDDTESEEDSLTLAEPQTVFNDAVEINESTVANADTIAPESDYQIDTIRVESQRLDKLLTQVGELLVTKGQIADQLVEIDEMITLWEELNRQAFIIRQAYRDLERRGLGSQLQQMQNSSNLTENRLKQLGEYLNRVQKKAFDYTARLEIISNELQSGVTSLRLLPLSTIFHLFPRTVRDLAKQQGKEVDLHIEGEQISVDKRIIEEMKDPLMHILRNAIDHGIETPQERLKLGKPPTATIHLKVYQTGNTVSIEVSDDGRGLDIEAIKLAAMRRGIRSQAELAAMSTAEIQALIFAPGFSTRTAVTEISGRGVGLDVVRANVERLKGTIQVEFTPGKGCLFRITISSIFATTHVLIVQVNQNSYAIPVEFVETMLLVSPQEIFAVEGSQTFPFQGQPVSVAWLADLLGLPVKVPASTQALNVGIKSIPCVILRLGSERLGLLVDTVNELQDIVLKPQSHLLKRVCNISGATILGTGEVCMVLNPPDLFKSAKKTVVSITVKELSEKAQIKQKILLVEDSIPIRTQMRRILESAGYEVTAAVDGQDGFNKLRESQFDAVISDIQMPNVDGLELTAKIRQLPEYKELPVILVTTMASEEDKRQGAQVGANAYITKGEFEQGEFLDTLRKFV
ncbi:two-component hybrid sensor and regulator [Scytonema sp. HK-05]|uniref:hybrid sensor histidine kinase/response regulator n=1 Tax=Scytonema sp. HK-05 TaxID=1137095 RepID=UPI000935B63C|nr:hybrid sensor histidine kinase/response regulator [Scytonema sp. HK-05]OKH55107.1 hybrid sensor histidine kinase/response regulator [Scytonema sp. HK-05]BAY43864.1 two-component hybrid sensor and regulator [Scytonema sp. HK-05]